MKPANLNHSYRLVWSDIHQAFVAVAEFATAKGKGSGRAAAVATVVLSTAMASGAAFAAGPSGSLPTGGNVVAGTGSISQSANALTINQSSNKLAVDWQSFSVGTGKTVNFVQPTSDSVALNRVLGSDVSVIQGSINANGQVFLVNPNGVLFTPSAQVNVGSIVASTLNISTADFMAGSYRFAGSSSNAIINQGNIQTIAGGTIALIAARIENGGQLTAPQGNVLIGAGQRVRLDLGGPVKIEVEAGALNAVIEQSGGIRADGGLVYLTAKAAGDLASAAINQTGLIEARTVATGQQGKIYLMADMDKGLVKVAGTLDASAPNGGNGGFIETSAAKVKVADGVNVTTAASNGKTGTWLIDPTDYTIAASGGDISGGTLSNTLLRNSVVVESTRGATSGNGDIFVNDAVSWSSASKLTLSASRNINIAADITATNSNGQVELQYGQGVKASGNAASYNLLNGAKINLQAGKNFFTKLGSDGSTETWKVITGAADLEAIGDVWTNLKPGTNLLVGNFVLGADVDASTSAFRPIGGVKFVYTIPAFAGVFDGLGHVVSGISISSANKDYVGLFGYASGATIRNVGVINANVSGYGSVGGLVGLIVNSVVSNSFVTGKVLGADYVGGLIGSSANSTVRNSYATADVTGIRHNIGRDGGGASGDCVGGLVGSLQLGSIVDNSYATGAVSGARLVAGLVGVSRDSTVSNSYSTGAFVGTFDASMALYAGGASLVGGLVGASNTSKVSNSFWNTTTSGQTSSAAGVGKTTAEMSSPSTFAGWDPTLWSFLGKGTSIAGYGISTAPYLASVTRVVDRPANTTLYDGGWGGLTGTPAGADGSAYGISTWTQLSNVGSGIAKTSNYKFELKSNLDSTTSDHATVASSTANAGAGFQPIGTSTTPFTGSFDGKGYTISNLTINRPTTDNVGLFGYVQNATLSNVGLVGGSVSGQNNVGFLVGYMGGLSFGTASVTKSYATGTVAGNNYVGGLVGHSGVFWGYANISQSYATGSVTGKDSVGGLVGGLDGLIGTVGVANSYATGSVSGGSTGSKIGGLVGQADGAGTNAPNGTTVTNSYAVGMVTGDTDVGGLVGKLTGANASVTTSFFDKTINSSASDAASYGKTTTEMLLPATFSSWDKTIWTTFAGGGAAVAGYGVSSLPVLTNVTRAADRPTDATLFDSGWGGQTGSLPTGADGSAYGISSWTQLDNVRKVLGDTTGYSFVLKTNLDSNSAGYATYASASANTNAGWTPIGTSTTPFKGTLDGKGNSISNLTINPSVANADIGLLGQSSGTVKNMDLVNASVTGSGANQNVGAVVGTLLSGGVIHNVAVDKTSAVKGAGSAQNLGGLAGTNKGTIDYSFVEGAVTSMGTAGYVGGIAGVNASSGTIRDTYVSGEVTGNNGAAAFGSTAAIDPSYNGGIAGKNEGTIANSLVLGNVKGAPAKSVTTNSSHQESQDTTQTCTESFGAPCTALGNEYIAQGGGTTPVSRVYNINTHYYTYSKLTTQNVTVYDSSTATTYFTGGIAGTHTGTSTDNYWKGPMTGTHVAIADFAGTGTTTAAKRTEEQLKRETTYLNIGSVAGAFNYKGSGNGYIPKIYRDIRDGSEYSSFWVLPIRAYLGASSVTYRGTEYKLSELWTSSSIFSSYGKAFDNMVAGKDYEFVSSGNAVTGFTNAAWYTDIRIRMKNGLEVMNLNPGLLTINPAKLTVTANAASKTYDGQEYSGGNGVSYLGFVNNETAAVLSGTLTYGGSSQNVGSYTISPSGLRSSNYAISYVSNTLTVNQRPVTVTADAQTKVVGDRDPALTYRADAGLLKDDDLKVVLGRDVGEVATRIYPISLSSSGNTNYAITYTGNTLSITPNPTLMAAVTVQIVGLNSATTATASEAIGGIRSSPSLLVSNQTPSETQGLTTAPVSPYTAEQLQAMTFEELNALIGTLTISQASTSDNAALIVLISLAMQNIRAVTNATSFIQRIKSNKVSDDNKILIDIPNHNSR